MASVVRRDRNKTNKWALRWRDASGASRETAFPTKRDAEDAKIKMEHDQRSGTFIEAELGEVAFVTYAAGVIELQKLSEGSRRLYNGILRTWITPWANGRSLAQVATDREGVQVLVNRVMRHLSFNRRGTTLTVILKAVDEAVNAGRINPHRLNGIDIIEGDDMPVEDKSFVYPTFSQVSKLADTLNGYGVTCWLMKACGLRVGEALAVEKRDFIDGGRTLKLSRQASDDGMKAIPLKHRKAGQYRLIPVPGYLWSIVRDLPEGVLAKPHGATKYITYNTFYRRFVKLSRELGIQDGFTPHSLRHAFATELLESGASLPSVAKWLGHADVSFTARKYHHVLKSSEDDARAMLDQAYAKWSVS